MEHFPYDLRDLNTSIKTFKTKLKTVSWINKEALCSCFVSTLLSDFFPHGEARARINTYVKAKIQLAKLK